MPESVIDQTVFNGLKESVGADFLPQLVDAFVEESPPLIAQLRLALAANDGETFRRSAHSIKSNAAAFGATPLFELARELEFMAREGRLGEVGGRVEVLEETFNRAAGALEKLCA